MGSLCGKEKAHMSLLTSAHFQYRLVFSMHQSFENTYEIVQVIGQGSTARISKIKRREPNRRRESSSHSLQRKPLRNSASQRTESHHGTDASSTASIHQSESQSELQSQSLPQPTKYFALKEIDLSMVKDEILDEFENEIKLLKGLVRTHTFTTRNP